MGLAVLDGGAGRLLLGLVMLDPSVELAGFFLPQLNQLELGVFEAPVVWQPVTQNAARLAATTIMIVARDKLVRMSDASLLDKSEKRLVQSGRRKPSSLRTLC